MAENRDQINASGVSIKLPILTSTSYARWKYDLRIILEVRDLWNVATGAEKPPAVVQKEHPVKAQGEEEAAFKARKAAAEEKYKQELEAYRLKSQEWATKDARAREIIARSLDERHHEMIRSQLTAARMLKTFEVLYEQKSASNVFQATREFHELKWSSDSTPIAYIARLQGAAAKLAALGEPVSDAMVIAKVMSELPARFSILKESWEISTLGGSKLTINDLTSQLIRLEGKKEKPEKTGSQAGESAAYFHRTQRPGTKKETRTCFSCKKVGHLAKDCWSKPKEQTKGLKSSTGGSKSGDKKQEQRSSAHVKSGYMMADLEAGDEWFCDSGATHHMTRRREIFSHLEEADAGLSVKNGAGKRMPVRGIGRVDILIRNPDGSNTRSWLDDVYYIPDLTDVNFFSLGRVTQLGYTAVAQGNHMVIRGGGRELIAERQPNNLYLMPITAVVQEDCLFSLTASMRTWHERMAHVSRDTIKRMAREEAVTGLPQAFEEEDSFCEGCVKGKMTKQTFASAEKRECKAGEFLHADLCGKMDEPSLGGSNYYALFKDDKTGYRKVAFLKTKDQTIDAIKAVVAEVKAETGNDVRWLRTDQGTEFLNQDVRVFLQEKGILHETSAAFVHEQNGTAERENRTLTSLARSMLEAKNLPKTLWAEAVMTAAYVMNRVLNRGDSITPYEGWFGKKPDVAHLRTFGSPAFALTPDEKRKKWDAKAEEKVLVGYTLTSKNYRLWTPGTTTVVECKHVIVKEADTASGAAREPITKRARGRPRGSKNKPKEATGGSGSVNADAAASSGATASGEAEITSERKSDSASLIPESADTSRREAVALMHVSDKHRKEDAKAAEEAWTASKGESVQEPVTVEEAMASKEWKEWRCAMEQEYDALVENGTWDLVDLPPDRKAIDSKWIFKLKRNPDGSIDRFKARLVIRGYQQVPGMDFAETFSPVVRATSIKVLLSIIAQEDLESCQVDVTTAFLNAPLDHFDIYMLQPHEFEDGSNRVCYLKKSLYGLKQAPLDWHEHVTSILRDMGFEPTDADQCIFVHEGQERVLLGLYVDDMILAAQTQATLESLCQALGKAIKITRKPLERFVGYEITRLREKKVILLTQEAYIKKMLQDYHMEDCNGVATPTDVNVKLCLNLCPRKVEERDSMDAYPYREMVGSLMFSAVTVRLDIAFAVQQLAQFTENPGMDHWIAAKRVLRYLKKTIDQGILLGSAPSDALTGYCDSDWGGSPDTGRSTSGILFTLFGGPVAWASRAQKCVTLSTAEAEYVSMSEGIKEAIWLRNLVKDLGLKQETVVLMNDNQATLRMIENKKYESRKAKHIEIKHHFIREKVAEGVVSVEHIATTEQPADMLTKRLPPQSLEKCKRRAGMTSLQALMLTLLALTCVPSADAVVVFHEAPSLVWRQMKSPVIRGSAGIIEVVKLDPDCSQMQSTEMVAWCEKFMDTQIYKMLDRKCTGDVMMRHRRFEPITLTVVLTIAIIGLLTVTNTAASVYTVTKVRSLEDEMRTREATLLKIQEEINADVIRVRDGLNNFTAAYAKREKLILSAIEFGSATSVFADKLKVFLHHWMKGRVTDEMMLTINASLPHDVPVSGIKPLACLWDRQAKTLTLKSLGTAVDTNKRVMRADPFRIYETKGTEMCLSTYSGTKTVIVDQRINSSCPVRATREQDVYLDVSAKDRCIPATNKWQQGQCFPIRDLEQKKNEVVQFMAIGYGMYVFCNGFSIDIFGTTLKCPKTVFLVPLNTSFRLEGISYTASIPSRLQVRPPEALTSWHQMIIAHMVAHDDTTNPYEIHTKSEQIAMEIEKEQASVITHGWTATGVAGTVAGLIVFLWILNRVMCRKKACHAVPAVESSGGSGGDRERGSVGARVSLPLPDSLAAAQEDAAASE